jgi:hypothetical protein
MWSLLGPIDVVCVIKSAAMSLLRKPRDTLQRTCSPDLCSCSYGMRINPTAGGPPDLY